MPRPLASHPSPRPAGLLIGLIVALWALATPARADILELEDGRLVEGVVVRSGESYVVTSRFGVAEIPAADVKELHAGKSVDQLVREHLATLEPEDTANRALLARWLVDLGRTEEGRALATAVLETDPEDANAHAVLGHVRHRGVWRTPEEARRAEGLERHGDRWYTPAEWASLEAEARGAAEEAERRAEAERLAADVNAAVRLMMSPDDVLRQRGRSQLTSMAAEYDNPRLLELVGQVEEYVREADAVAARVAGLGAGGAGTVMGEFRVTLSRLKRPIETFETSLASNIGGAPVRIQIPELEVIRVRTTGVIPVVVR